MNKELYLSSGLKSEANGSLMLAAENLFEMYLMNGVVAQIDRLLHSPFPKA